MRKKKEATVFDLKNTRTGKYLIAKSKGLPKKESAIIAGFSENTAMHNTDKIENTHLYRALEKKFFKDVISSQITMEEIGNELVKNIKQDVNLGAKNQAIQMALDKLEPEESLTDRDERVFVVIR